MKNHLATIFFVVLYINLSKAQTNFPNASIPTNSSNNATTPLTTLYIGAFFDLGTKDGYGSLPMAQQAIDEINNNTEILPGYRLELVINSTQGNFGFGQKVLHEFLKKEPKKIMLLGPGQDSLAKSVAAYAGIPDVSLLQFSYGTSDLELANNRGLYPNFFRTKTSLASLDEPRIKFIKQYGWDEVGIIYGDSVQYLKLSNQLADRLKQNGITVLAEVRLQANDPKRAIRTIKDKGIHVILGMFSRDAVTRKMICEAYHQKMYGPHYVWMLIKSANNNWWIPGKNEDITCSDLEMKCQIQNHFSFYHTIVLAPKGRFYSYAKKNGSQIIDDYHDKVDNGSDTSNRSSGAMNVYDAVWSIAFVLHQSKNEILNLGTTLENLTYGDVNATAVFRRQAEKLDFETPNIGTRVRYYANGDRKNGIIIKQIVITDGKFTSVSAGKFDVETNGFTASSEIHWFAGTPYTKTTETYIYRTIDRTLFIVLVVFASLGIVYALFCLLVLVLNFKKKIVHNSGPVISMLIIFGCILNYVTVILYGFDYALVSPDTVTKLCRARAWTFAIGFTLSVGGLAAKLWMAYSVLKDRFVRSRNVMMFWMLGILFLFLMVDVIILICWEGRDPLYRALKQVRSQPEYKCFEPITADTFRAQIEVVEHCDCADLTLWLVVILVFKVLILLTGGFLAWQTRRVYIPALNDTQHCVSCMFIVVLFCLVGAVVSFTTTMYPSAYYGVIGALIIIATTMILVLLFVNKIVRLSCKRRRTKTVIVGDASAGNTKYSCANGTVCAKFCSCCACSAACFMTCCSCFPFCNLYSCLRSFFCGSQVHPAAGNGAESKAEFYIGGIAQDRDAQIVYLTNELREKNTQLSNLGHHRTVKSIWTQTMDDGSYIWDHDDDDSMLSDGNVSDVESGQSSGSNKRFRRAANKVRIFSEAADYSHIKSKVNTGIQRSSLAPNSPKPRRGSRMSVMSSDEDIMKLKTTLAQKDEEIKRLRKELEGSKIPGSAVKTQQSSTVEQEMAKTFPNTQRIVLIETPATPIPPEDPDEFTSTTVQLPVTSIPSKSENNVNETSPGSGMETTPAAEIKTQDRSKKKSSLGPAGLWLLEDQSESTKDDENSVKKAQRKDSKTRKDDKNSEENAPRKDSKTRKDDKNAEANTPRKDSKTRKDDKNSEENAPRKVSKDSSMARKDGDNHETNTSRKNSNDSNKAASKEEDKINKKTSLGSGSCPMSDNKTETFGDDNIKLSPQDSTEASRRASLTHVALSVYQDTESPGKNAEQGKPSKEVKDVNEQKQKQDSIQDNVTKDGTKQVSNDDQSNKGDNEPNSENSKDEYGNKKEEPKVKKKSLHRKISSWLFGDDEEKDDTQKDKNENKMDDKDNKENRAGNENHGDKSYTNANEEINRTDKEGQQMIDEKRDSVKVDVDKDVIGKETGTSDGVTDEASKDENVTKGGNREEDDANEDSDGRNMEKIDEEGEDSDDDTEIGDDDNVDDDDDDNDNGGEAQDENAGNGGGATRGTKGRRGSKKGGRRRKKIGFGKLKWNAQSKVDTGSTSYKPKTSAKKIPQFKNDYAHVKSRLSTLTEANTIEKAVDSPTTRRRQRSISFNKSPDYSNVRPRLYNGTTRKYNSEMLSNLPK